MDIPAEQDERASYLELFFDLVFVFAITQITHEQVRSGRLLDPSFPGCARDRPVRIRR